MIAVRERSESGFTIIEAMVAVTVLAAALVLSIQPVMSTLGIINQSRVVSTAENLAQAEIEQIRAIGYDDVGLPDATPGGVLTPSREVTIEGSVYTIDLAITYAGSVTGLNVVEGGGDGVPGAWDSGVDYKYVQVTVTPHDRAFDPVVMETIVAPPNIGAHEAIANVRVTIAPYEPFGTPTSEPLPTIRIAATGLGTYRSIERVESVVFAGVKVGTYDIALDVPGDWVIHPDDVLEGETVVVASPATTTDALVRVFLPATLTFVVTDAETGLSVTPSSITLTRVSVDEDRLLGPGETVATDLPPDTYNIAVSAVGYHTATFSSLQIPSNYPIRTDTLNVALEPTNNTFADVDIYVVDNNGLPIAGAVVETDDPVNGELGFITDAAGHTTASLPEGFPTYIIAHTDTGHESADTTIDAATTTSVTLTLLPPTPSGDLIVTGATDGTIVYRPYKSKTWIEVQPNADGEVSLALAYGKYEVAKLCSDGDVIGKKKVRVRTGRTTTQNIKYKC
jgi:type II secretory pathway pseudopilin PulG